MSNDPILFGEGSFGCAYRPAIPCSNASNSGINEKISKVLTVQNADNEYAEYDRISQADPTNKFYLGKPQSCYMSAPDFDTHVKPSGCGIVTPNTSYTDYKLLQYKDGGSDLADFATIHLTKFLSTWKQRQSDHFWLKAHTLFMGLKNYAENNILHDDLKPQNIVFKFDLTKDTMDFNYIDFGLVDETAELIAEVTAERTDRLFHWSRPMEQGFLTKTRNFKNLYQQTDATVLSHYCSTLSNIILKKKNTNPYNIKPASFMLAFEYTEDRLAPNTNLSITERIRACIEGILHYRTDPDAFVKKSIETTDIYALGFSLNYVANKMHLKSALSDAEYTRFHQFFEKMYDFNLFTRYSDINAILDEYESVLSLNGVLRRLGKRFLNHTIVADNKPVRIIQIPALTLQQAQAIGSSSPSSSSSGSSFARAQPNSPIFSPSGSSSSPVFKARAQPNSPIFSPKSPTPKVAIKKKGKAKSLKPCPPGKERNPVTRRCIKICPPGQTRRNGRCVKP
jgi:serine/threonine protein kinase